MKTFKLHLIRHGLTRGNLEGLYIGSGTDLPLCKEGKESLSRLQDQFTYPVVDTVFTSPLSRAVETAQILFPAATHKMEVQDLREMDFGVFENRPMSELVKDPEFAAWMDPSSHTVPEGAENRADFYRRTGDALMKMFEYMMKMGITEAACVTHGGVIMSMLAQHAFPQRKPEDWMADPGCGYTVRCDVQMWMRDGMAEAIDVVPYGYLDDQEDSEEE